jgi:hypothetical protein
MPFGVWGANEMVKNWVLHHDDVPCQTALAVRQLLVKNQTAAILQLTYPSNLTPCNFCHFSKPKTRLKGHRFTSAEEIQQNIAAPSKDDFQRHFQKWQDCWSKLYLQKGCASRVTALHFIHIHFSTDYDHVPETIWSSHITQSSTCL